VNYLVKTKKPKAVSFDVQVSQADWKLLETVLDRVCSGIKLGIFLPNRSFFGCSRRWCAYWPECEEECGGRIQD